MLSLILLRAMIKHHYRYWENYWLYAEKHAALSLERCDGLLDVIVEKWDHHNRKNKKQLSVDLCYICVMTIRWRKTLPTKAHITQVNKVYAVSCESKTPNRNLPIKWSTIDPFHSTHFGLNTSVPNDTSLS